MKKSVFTVIIISAVHFIVMTVLSVYSVADTVTLSQIWNVIITAFGVITLFPVWLMIWGVIQGLPVPLPYFYGLGLYCLVYGSVVYLLVKRVVLAVKRRK